MNTSTPSFPIESKKTERVIGTYTSGLPGVHVVLLGGIHGNEPSGVTAIQQVLTDLKEQNISIKGKITGLRGNIPALSQGNRFVDRDLNRIWNTDFTPIEEVHESITEKTEKLQLIEQFKKILDGKQTPVFIDLHTTSANGSPFIAIGDTLRNRKLCKDIPTPVILGFEEYMKGTLFNFFNFLGVCSMLFEGGQHDSKEAIDNHVSFIWMALANLGCLTRKDIPNYEELYQQLLKSTEGKSEIYETVYRYAVKERSLFEMDPDYDNFQTVEKNESIASYNGERIHINNQGNIFMPLYQKQGEDGFFIIRKVNPFWIWLSQKLRQLKLEGSFGWLPGVKPHSSLEKTFLINSKIARLFPRQFFHLFGYKQLFHGDDQYMVMARRKYDLTPPDNGEIYQGFKQLISIN